MLKTDTTGRRPVYRTDVRYRVRCYASFSDDFVSGSPPGAILAGLFASISVAEKVVKAARKCHLAPRTSDKASAFAELFAGGTKIAMILIDWDSCEAEAYKLLASIREKEHLKKVPVLGFVSQGKSALIGEAQKAGCDRVLTKTEFMTNLETIIARCAL